MVNQQELKLHLLLRVAALAIIWGALLSGPVSFILTLLTKPQPPWNGIEPFVRNFHWIQTVPFVLGFVLMLGSCLFVAVAVRFAREEAEKAMASLALICITVYAALIAFNYIIQIAYIPAAIKSYQNIIPLLTMSNPASLCWAVEMFGYMFQGIAFWLLDPVFFTSSKFKLIKGLLLINLLLSIGGALAACIDVTWAMRPFGIVMFITWNLVLIALMWVIAADIKSQSRNTSDLFNQNQKPAL